ncbi:MAG: hypothetical protein EOP38_07290 [Rubrivivax sp.]|nr:MAG: hypothetical protein EOP38_07290 [Rubrivivax sp.]
MGAGKGGIFRAHLSLHVQQVLGTDDTKLLHLGRLMREAANTAATIVFVHDARTAARLQDALNVRVATSVLHANQSPAERQAQRQAFLSGNTSVLVSTPLQHELARPDVRLVIHHDWPSTLNVYHRQIMEAGRDGWPSRAVLLCGLDDHAQPRRARSAGFEHLLAFSRTRSCRWRLLQEHLGDELAFTRCGACDNCERLDADTEAAVRGSGMPAARSQALENDDAVDLPWLTQTGPLARDNEAPALRQGLAVAVDRHGWGWVQRVDEALISVDFPDGHSGRFTPALVHPLSQHALDFAARLLPASVSALRLHEDDHLDNSLTYHQLLSRDRTTSDNRPSMAPALGPSDSSDSGSDVAWWNPDTNGDVEQDFSTDASGTGERWGVESGSWREAFDIAPDRIVDSPNEGIAEP